VAHREIRQQADTEFDITDRVDEFRMDTSALTAQEMELATLLVGALTGPFEPAKYKDHYQENLRALIDTKVQGQEVAGSAAQPSLVPVVDILEALKASLGRKKQPQAATAEARRTRRAVRLLKFPLP